MDCTCHFIPVNIYPDLTGHHSIYKVNTTHDIPGRLVPGYSIWSYTELADEIGLSEPPQFLVALL